MSLLHMVNDLLKRSMLVILPTLLPLTAYSSSYIPLTPTTAIFERDISGISDPRGILRREERMALEDSLREFWKRTGMKAQILVTVSNNRWENLEAFSERIARAWGLNRQSNLPGDILVVVDPDAREAALQVPAALNRELPAGALRGVLNDTLTPALKRGEIASGITDGLHDMATLLEHSNRINRSLFLRGYGVLASVGIFLAGMVLRRRWGPVKSAITASICFGAVVCYDGFITGFSWYEVISFVLLTAPFLGLFVWIGMGGDIPTETEQK